MYLLMGGNPPFRFVGRQRSMVYKNGALSVQLEKVISEIFLYSLHKDDNSNVIRVVPLRKEYSKEIKI
jgi:hypothetical protein